MSLQDLGNIGEFIAAIGVIVSLIYLAFQIRQNTVSLRLNNYLGSETLSSEVAKPLVQDPELARVFRAGQRHFDSLSGDEQVRFITLFALQFRAYEQMFLQHRRSLIDSEVWEARRDAMLRFISEPGVQEMWKERSHSFSRSFREFVEQVRTPADERTAREDPEAHST